MYRKIHSTSEIIFGNKNETLRNWFTFASVIFLISVSWASVNLTVASEVSYQNLDAQIMYQKLQYLTREKRATLGGVLCNNMIFLFVLKWMIFI